jgi:hypothetical protein
MATITQVSVLAMTPGKTFPTPISLGLQNANVRGVNPVREASGLWIGKMQPPPANAASINAEIVVGRDEMTGDVQYYYVAQSVTATIALING